MSREQRTTRRVQRQARREERLREEERLRAAKKRRTIGIWTGIGVIVVVILAIVFNNFLGDRIFRNILNNRNAQANNNTSNSITSDNPAYPVVDNIACQSMERLDYHIHAHLSLYVNGQSVPLPANIGIASNQSCIYWLHTHDASGMLHIESPTTKTYSLGTFLKLWYDHFSQLGYPTQLNTTDVWKVYVDGKPYTGDFHTIQLLPHSLITMAYNSPDVKPDTTYNWGDK